MTLSSSPLLDYGIAFVLPGITSFIAGLLRQDGWSAWINDTIAYLFIFLLSLGYILAQGKITGNPIADFVLVLSYTGVVMRWTALKNLQSFLQSNWLNFGNATNADGSPAPAQPTIDTRALAADVVQLLHESKFLDPVYQIALKFDSILAQRTGGVQAQPQVAVPVPQLQFPPLPQYTAPQAAISSSQAQQQPGQAQ